MFKSSQKSQCSVAFREQYSLQVSLEHGQRRWRRDAVPGLQSLILRTLAKVFWSTDLPLLLGCCCCCCCRIDRQMDGKTPDQRFKPMLFAKDTASVIYNNNDQTSIVERHKKIPVCRFTVFLLFMLSSFHIAPMCCESELLINSSAYRRYRRLGQDIT